MSRLSFLGLFIPLLAMSNDIGFLEEPPKIHDRFYHVTLTAPENVRRLSNNILEVAAVLPKGTSIHIQKSIQPVFYDYRDSFGKVRRSSNGFFHGIEILSVTPEYATQLPPDKIDELNAIDGGLYISSLVLNDLPNDGEIPVLTPADPSDDYLLYYDSDGRPLTTFTSKFKKRFGSKLNEVIPLDTLSPRDQTKWQNVYWQMNRASNRIIAAPANLMFMNIDEAQRSSILFEEQGVVQESGAWTIAVRATAPRHDFANVPCAEFVSEVIRQAYKRAGFDFTEDFNEARGNELFWNKSSAVVRLTDALVKGGWVPWDSASFRPLIGAPMMHYLATTPGHAYLVAQDGGAVIVDNGSPQGRDLHVTAAKTIKLMYLNGVFFLPPGIIPPAWN